MLKKGITRFDERIEEINEIVGYYEIQIPDLEKTLKVKVLKLLKSETDCYMGIANLEVKGKGADDYYRSIREESTKEDALNDAITGFFAFYNKSAKIREVEIW